MRLETVYIEENGCVAEMKAYLLDESHRDAPPQRRSVLIIPGGGYHFVSAREAEPIALKYLAAGITNTINIFQPDILCIGGGVCNEGDALLIPVKKLIAQEIYTRNSKKNTEIVIAKLGNDAGIIGAAFLGMAK